MARVHPTALVDPGAQLAGDVEVGPYSVIGAGVTIGRGTIVGPHVVVTGRTSLGARNRIFQFTSIGDIPQDRKYGGEPTTTTIGDDIAAEADLLAVLRTTDGAGPAGAPAR